MRRAGPGYADVLKRDGGGRRAAGVSPFSRARDSPRRAVERAPGPRSPIVIILQLGHLPVTYFSSPSLLQSEWAVGQVRSSHVKTPVASSLVEPATSELRVTLKMAVAVVLAAAAADAAAAAAARYRCYPLLAADAVEVVADITAAVVAIANSRSPFVPVPPSPVPS